jgi:hypothetical protein
MPELKELSAANAKQNAAAKVKRKAVNFNLNPTI